MHWLVRGKRIDPWDDQVPESIDDLDAAHRIRIICEAAADISKDITPRSSGAAAKERYERATRAALQIALRISDDLVRDAALRQIIDVCVKANDVHRAEVLLRGIQAASIREAVLKDNPVLCSEPI
jgi:hypothetical protein